MKSLILNFALLLAWAIGGLASALRADTVLESALLQLVAQVDVPARTAGVLASVDVVEGMTVEVGKPLAQVDDRQVQMLYQRAGVDLKLSKEKSANDVAIRSANRALEFAQAELSRLERASTGLSGSISQSQIEDSRLRVSKSQFELEAAQHEARVNKLNQQLKEQEFELSKYETDVRRISAPIPGMVVDVFRHAGEWVEPGDKVVRIVRIDRLRAEGLVHNNLVRPEWQRLDVSVSVEMPDQAPRQAIGKIVFVSPEVNPVNGLVRISVEFENPNQSLKPGQRARIAIPDGGSPSLPRRVTDVK